VTLDNTALGGKMYLMRLATNTHILLKYIEISIYSHMCEWLYDISNYTYMHIYIDIYIYICAVAENGGEGGKGRGGEGSRGEGGGSTPLYEMRDATHMK